MACSVFNGDRNNDANHGCTTVEAFGVGIEACFGLGKIGSNRGFDGSVGVRHRTYSKNILQIVTSLFYPQITQIAADGRIDWHLMVSIPYGLRRKEQSLVNF